jgi:hypothetical protein
MARNDATVGSGCCYWILDSENMDPELTALCGAGNEHEWLRDKCDEYQACLRDLALMKNQKHKNDDGKKYMWLVCEYKDVETKPRKRQPKKLVRDTLSLVNDTNLLAVNGSSLNFDTSSNAPNDTAMQLRSTKPDTCRPITRTIKPLHAFVWKDLAEKFVGHLIETNGVFEYNFDLDYSIKQVKLVPVEATVIQILSGQMEVAILPETAATGPFRRVAWQTRRGLHPLASVNSQITALRLRAWLT